MNKKNQKEKDQNTPLIIFLVIVLLIGLGGIGYFIYEMAFNQEIELKYTLDVYKNHNLYICDKKSKDCDTLAFTIKTETEDAKIISYNIADDSDYILYNDNGLKLYVSKTKEIKKINLKDNYKFYNISLNNDKTEAIGIIYNLENYKYGYYDLSKNMNLYDTVYTNISMIDEKYLTASDDNHVYLLSTTKKEIIMSEEIEPVEYGGYYFHIKQFNDKYFYYLTYYADSMQTLKLYSDSQEIFFEKRLEEEEISFNDGYVYLVDNNMIKKYDIDGNLKSTSNQLNNIKGLINNYVVYVENNNLMIKNLDNNEYSIVDKWDNQNNYDTWAKSGYYTREQLDIMGETDKPEGVYIVVYYPNVNSEGNYGVEYCYTLNKEIKKYDIKTPMGGRAKPVLYLYPTKTTNVKVTFQYPEYLTTTYPKFNNSWEIEAHPNGDLYDQDGKYYYALYWDEIRYHEVDFQEGFYVEKENAIDFLEEKLSIIGLNDRERNEFIMYWLPILENNEKNLVYFELTEERENSNKLIIKPSPDSILRVSIHIKKVDEFVNIKEQELKTFNRYGFTAVEWGGMTY